MFFYRILQEYLLNIILILSLFLVSIISSNALTQPFFVIAGNISYGLIVSILFYYINIIYVTSKQDSKARTYLLKKYKELRETQMNIIYGVLLINRRATFNRDLLYDPSFFTHYFLTCRKSGNIWFELIVDKIDIHSKDILINEMTQYKQTLLNHFSLLNLTDKSKINLYHLIDQIERIERGSDDVFYNLILANGCGLSLETGKFYETDPQLFFLDKRNFTFKKWLNL